MKRACRQRGLSMIEVLVSLSVVAFGLLGLAGLQARSMSYQKDSFDRKAAAELAAQLTERVRANYDGFRAGNYNVKMEIADATPTVVPGCATVNACTPAEVAARDFAMWTMQVRSKLPASGAFVAAPANSIALNLVMAWQESLTDPTQAADPDCVAVGIADISYRCFAWMVHP